MNELILHLPVRWHPTVPPEEVPAEELHGAYREAIWPLRAAQCALVLVDCWDRHPLESHLRNSGAMSREVLMPLRQACRAAGIAIVHAPSPPQALLYPEWTHYAGDAELGFAPRAEPDAWPPSEFRQRTGEWAPLERPYYLRDVTPNAEGRRIFAELEPAPGEFVVATGAQLHRLCRHRGILHLLYTGFATNMCVILRDYGIIAMSQRGYNAVLLRDATLGIEAANTYAAHGLTEATFLQVEMLWGVTSTAADLRAALAREGCDDQP